MEFFSEYNDGRDDDNHTPKEIILSAERLKKLQAQIYSFFDRFYSVKNLNSNPANYLQLSNAVNRAWRSQIISAKYVCHLYTNVGVNHLKRREIIDALEKYLAECATGNTPNITLKSLTPNQNRSWDSVEARVFDVYEKKHAMKDTFSDGDPVPEFELFDIDDLETLKRMPAKEIFGEDIHWEKIEERFAVNENIIRGMKEITPLGDTLIVGYFIMYPITSECNTLIQKGTIIQSGEFKNRHICREIKSAAAIYISLVYADGYYEKALILEKLKTELRILLSINPSISLVYVRPTTQDGKRVVLRHRFKKLEVTPSLFYKASKELLKGKEILNK